MWDVKASKSDISLGKCQWEALVQSAAWEVLVDKGMYTGHVWLGWWINNSITLHTKMILSTKINFRELLYILPWFELELLSHTKWFRWIYPSHTLDLATVVLHDSWYVPYHRYACTVCHNLYKGIKLMYTIHTCSTPLHDKSDDKWVIQSYNQVIAV